MWTSHLMRQKNSKFCLKRIKCCQTPKKEKHTINLDRQLLNRVPKEEILLMADITLLEMAAFPIPGVQMEHREVKIRVLLILLICLNKFLEWGGLLRNLVRDSEEDRCISLNFHLMKPFMERQKKLRLNGWKEITTGLSGKE